MGLWAERLLSLALAIAVVAGGGVLYGNYSHRWEQKNKQVAVDCVAAFPKDVGNWTFTELEKLSPGELEQLEPFNYVRGKYVNRQTGSMTSMALLVGTPGPIAVHIPEICFSSVAYKQRSERTAVKLSGDAAQQTSGPHSFWKVGFDNKNSLAGGLHVYYAWSNGEEWIASPRPRFDFAASPWLYKIQVAVPIDWRKDSAARDDGQDFLEALLASGWRPLGANEAEPKKG